MYVVIWKYSVKKEKRTEFEGAYGRNGLWAAFFRRASGYRETELLLSTDSPSEYLTIDRWNDSKSYESFLAEHQVEYKDIDKRCTDLTDSEQMVGEFIVKDL